MSFEKDPAVSAPVVNSIPTPRSSRPSLKGAPEPIAALNRVRITEYARPWQEREPLEDIRHYCPDVVCVERICPYLRRTVADKLNHAQASLPAGYRLKAGTALRTLSMQSHGWDNYFKRMREEHPDWPLSALRRATNKYFAPYDQKAPPGHCTGGAVDVALLDPEGNGLDMTAPTTGWEAAYTWSDKLSPEAKANRMIMVEAMLGAGFSNCRDEFWHYSWGDSAWAVRVGETECPYGWAHPAVALETDFEDATARDCSIETSRDLNGRALRAEGECAWPADSRVLRVGLNWARSVPATITIHAHSREPAAFYAVVNAESWEPIADVTRRSDGYLLTLIPQADRIVLATEPPAAEKEK